MKYYKLLSSDQIEWVRKVELDGMRYTNPTLELITRAGIEAYPYTPSEFPNDGKVYTHSYVLTDGNITDQWTVKEVEDE